MVPPELDDNPLGRFIGSVPLVGRFLKVSDRGVLEEQRAAEAADDAVGAAWRTMQGQRTAQLRADLAYLQGVAPERLEEPQRERLAWLKQLWAPIYGDYQKAVTAALRDAGDPALAAPLRQRARAEAEALVRELEEHAKGAAEEAP
jgi:hypothetical protein